MAKDQLTRNEQIEHLKSRVASLEADNASLRSNLEKANEKLIHELEYENQLDEQELADNYVSLAQEASRQAEAVKEGKANRLSGVSAERIVAIERMTSRLRCRIDTVLKLKGKRS